MNQKIPQHVAIVMDGNGRWAQQRGLERTEGHRNGVDVVKTMVKACLEKNIPILSIWAFGRENWARPAAEVNFLMQLFLQSLEHEHQELNQHGVRLHFTGDRTALSEALQQQMQSTEALTVNNQRLILNVMINYGGKWDIIQAVKRVVNNLQDQALTTDVITEEYFSQYLCMHDLPDPDLFIRTSGEQRLSNFFLWQLAYAELYFTEVHWPDFTIEEFEKALASYSARERRYGQTSQQLVKEEHV